MLSNKDFIFNAYALIADMSEFDISEIPFFECPRFNITKEDLQKSICADEYFSEIVVDKNRIDEFNQDFDNILKNHNKIGCGESCFIDYLGTYINCKCALNELFDNPIFKSANGKQVYEYKNFTNFDIMQKQNIDFKKAIHSMDTDVLHYLCNSIYETTNNSFITEKTLSYLKGYIDAEIINLAKQELLLRGEIFYTKEDCLNENNEIIKNKDYDDDIEL